jgi:histone-lysine N-methyltransferase EZH2
MRRHVHTLVGESVIPNAGFGLYTKHSLRKGDYVIEYVGEQISQEEAERRGVVYDKMNMSYLFNLSSDLVIDATRKGNKSRYMNHSSEPNMEPKMIFVNGDMRIGFFAKTDIDAQSELFFDYRYDDKLDNELIYKPDHSINFDWMKKKKK